MVAFRSLSVRCALVAALSQSLVAGQQQVLIPDDLPPCVLACTTIQQALTDCSVNPATAATCFCQSPSLSPITAAGTNVCTGFCTDPDFTTIRTWYRNFCADPTNPGNGQVATTPTTTSTSTETAGPATAAGGAPAQTTATSASSSSENPEANRPESGSQWWSNHWEWVLMVIILVVAFGAIGIGGSIWYKRRQRRREGWDNPRPEMSTWAPGQHSVHDFGGAEPPGASTAGVAAASAAEEGRGKRRERTTVTEQPGTELASKSKRLKKVLGRA